MRHRLQPLEPDVGVVADVVAVAELDQEQHKQKRVHFQRCNVNGQLKERAYFDRRTLRVADRFSSAVFFPTCSYDPATRQNSDRVSYIRVSLKAFAGEIGKSWERQRVGGATSVLRTNSRNIYDMVALLLRKVDKL